MNSTGEYGNVKTYILVAWVFALLVVGAVPIPVGASPTSTGPTPSALSSTIPSGTVDPEYSITNWIPSKTWNGTTFFGNANTSQIVEVNMKGEVVWRYQFPTTTGTHAPFFTGVMVVPGSNNVLFAVIEPVSLRGCYEVSLQGQLVWSYLNKTISHDCVRLPNGDTLVAAAHAEDYSPWPYTQAEVYEVNHQGQIVWSWHAKQDFQNSKYANVRSTDFGNWTHVNEALQLPNGNYMISPRNFNMTIIVDKSGNLLKSFGNSCTFACGPANSFINPHSPIPLSNGNYLVGMDGNGWMLEYNPSTNQGVWLFPTPIPRMTQSQAGMYFIRGQQRLPNGNTLMTDSNGQVLEITQSGQIVWQLKCKCYNSAGAGANFAGSYFFQGERLSYMPPGFTVSSPTPRSTYSGSVPLTVSSGVDLGNMTYSIRNNTNNTWAVRNATLIQNLYSDSLDQPKTVKGPSTLSLSPGNYTLRLFASSTGYGYKAFVQQKRVNYASQDITFVVNAISTTSSSITTTSTASSTTITSTSTSTTRPIPEFPGPAVLIGFLAPLAATALLASKLRRRG